MHLVPVVDAFVHKQSIFNVHVTHVSFGGVVNGKRIAPIPPKILPHFYYLRRPYKFIFDKGGLLSDAHGNVVAATSHEFFADGLQMTSQVKNEVSEPVGGYWSCPDMIGNRNWLYQWVMAPKKMNRYAYACYLAHIAFKYLDYWVHSQFQTAGGKNFPLRLLCKQFAP